MTSLLTAWALCALTSIFGKDRPPLHDFTWYPAALSDATPKARAAAKAELVKLERAYWRYVALPTGGSRNSDWARLVDAEGKLIDGYLGLISNHKVADISVCAWMRIGDVILRLSENLERFPPTEPDTAGGPELVESHYPGNDGSIARRALEAFERGADEAKRLGIDSRCAGRSAERVAFLRRANAL